MIIPDVSLALPNKQTSGKTMTVVPLGHGRGGTTCVTGIVHYLGIPMLPDGQEPRIGPDYFNFEDQDAHRAMQDGAWEALSEHVQRRNGESDRWGFKSHWTLNHIVHIDPMLRKPVYIGIFRDPVAVLTGAMAREPSARVRLRLADIAGAYCRLADWLDSTSAPCLAVSYERILKRPERAVGDIAKFLGVDVTEAAISFIRRS